MLEWPPGSIIASQKEGQAYLVLAPGSLGLLAWMLEAIELEGVGTAYRPIQQSTALVFLHICDLEEWLDISFEVQMVGNHGGLVMVPSGPSENLCAARVKQGLQLTVKQALACISCLGIKIPSQKSKPAIYKLLIDSVLATPEEREDAFQKSAVMKGDGQEDSQSNISDYEELIKLVEEDAENQGDQDLKQEREQVNQHPLKMPKFHQGMSSLAHANLVQQKRFARASITAIGAK
ncbi:unnamed protein product [Cladocopium goreaui]|uniref:Reticulocyte-binding protein 2-like a n=1 Tax=Cladocopium goreaui TaxID=2562237 RepID=A0A9P1C618_9DINO|nr:unnamed protein product [Cladocopium goreaui]